MRIKGLIFWTLILVAGMLSFYQWPDKMERTGPIKTLAAAGISNFRKMLDLMERTAPLRRNVTIEEVGNTAAFLCSDLASGITGEVTYVDAGYNVTGMPPLGD